VIVRSVGSDVLGTMRMAQQTTTETTQSGVTKEDQSLIFRVVGFLEYVTALRYLDPLARSATAEEREALDQLIQEYPEFAVYTNLAARYQTGGINAAQHQIRDDDRRSGLRWVLALARVEVGGILATFAQMPYPFVSVSPTDYEMAAYRDLLMDGARMHYLSLTNDPMLQRAAQGIPGRAMFMYIRRLRVATAFIEAAGGSNAADLTPLQQAEIAARRQELRALAAMFAQQIGDYLAATQNIRQQQNGTTVLARESRALCAGMMAGEREGLTQGTAKVLQFDSR
jgi:hypothetical protein